MTSQSMPLQGSLSALKRGIEGSEPQQARPPPVGFDWGSLLVPLIAPLWIFLRNQNTPAPAPTSPSAPTAGPDRASSRFEILEEERIGGKKKKAPHAGTAVPLPHAALRRTLNAGLSPPSSPRISTCSRLPSADVVKSIPTGAAPGVGTRGTREEDGAIPPHLPPNPSAARSHNNKSTHNTLASPRQPGEAMTVQLAAWPGRMTGREGRLLPHQVLQMPTGVRAPRYSTPRKLYPRGVPPGAARGWR